MYIRRLFLRCARGHIKVCVFVIGAKYCLEVKYERQLSSNSMSLTTGPFGRVSDKDRSF